MSERYLTYNPGRRQVWTEHECWPAKAIRLWRNPEQDRGWTPSRHRSPFRVYRIHEGGEIITEVPESEWDDHDG